MSLASGQNKISYDVSASTTTFAFPYKYWESSDLEVSTENKTSGVISTLIAGTDYSIVAVNGDPANGANITLITAVSNDIVVIERVVPLKSDADFTIGDGIPPESLNESIDKLAAQTQQLNEQVGRQVVFPVTDASGLTYELPAVSIRKNKIFAFDVFGSVTVVELAETGSFGADNTKGIAITGNVAACKTDDLSIGFDTGGNMYVKDSGIETDMLQDDCVTLAKMEHRASMTVIGNVTGSVAGPAEVSVLDEDDMVSNSAAALATQQSIKAYVDSENSDLQTTLEAFQMKYSGVEVFNGSMPASYTDLDLSSVVGANRAFVHLRVLSDTSNLLIRFRENGETKVIGESSINSREYGTSAVYLDADHIGYVSLITDAAGIIEWEATGAGAGASTVGVLSYQRLN